MDLLKEAYRLTRKTGAVGVDGQTADEYAKDLVSNLTDLLGRLKSGSYKAPPVRRHYIPKADGSHRPLGIPTFEDKVAQRAVTMILEEVYEQEFLECSYGFRKKRSAHQALQEIRNKVMDHKAHYVLDIDIMKFFDSIDHNELRKVLDQRVVDGVLRRLIDKWLKAGVMEEGQLSNPDTGTPQGGVISPLLANIFLNHIIDQWFEQEVKPRLKGKGSMVRFCDDIVMCFSDKSDATKVMDVLQKRLGRFKLTMHETKSRMVDFRPPPFRLDRKKRKSYVKTNRKLETFNFLGFTHYWDVSRRGYWVVNRKTMGARFSRAIKNIQDYCRRNRHKPVVVQYKRLCLMIRGHYGYYGITGNGYSISKFLEIVKSIWKKWLSRRSRRSYIKWDYFNKVILETYVLPTPRIVHKYNRGAKL